MSTSWLYHGFGVRGYQYWKTQYVEGGIVMWVTQPPESCRCSACGSADVAPRGEVERRFRGPPIGRKPVTIVLPIPRIECGSCGLVRQVAVQFAEPRRTYTRSFARYALDLSRSMTVKDVAQHLGISWDVIKDLVKANLARRFAKPKLKHLKQLAIDEISVGKGHRY